MVIPEVLYVAGEGEAGEGSALFFNPNENAGDLTLFDSRMLASKNSSKFKSVTLQSSTKL